MIIRDAKESEYNELAKLHISAFPNFFLSTLGEHFLSTYYKVVLHHPEAICLFAEDEDTHVICGFVLGRVHASGYLKRIVKSNPFPFVWEAFLLMFTRPKALIRIMRNFENKKRDDDEIHDEQNYAEIGLIGVNPEIKGKGIGHKLFREMEVRLKEGGAEEVSLTTDVVNNENTLIAYKAWGFQVYYKFTCYPNREMYRLIKKL